MSTAAVVGQTALMGALIVGIGALVQWAWGGVKAWIRGATRKGTR